jgi:hypothetical protein
MVEANLQIIEELKNFLNTVSCEADVRKLFTGLDVDFSRERKLRLNMLVSLIINLPKRSLSIEIQEFFDSLAEGSKASTKSAFSQQRTKLSALFFRVWNQWLVDGFYNYYGEKVKRWRGLRVQAVDGSTAYLIKKKR